MTMITTDDTEHRGPDGLRDKDRMQPAPGRPHDYRPCEICVRCLRCNHPHRRCLALLYRQRGYR